MEHTHQSKKYLKTKKRQQGIMICDAIIKDKKILLMRRFEGVWEVPGGGIEFGEHCLI